MRKLKLRMDDLRVDSFDTARAPGAAGTVRGHDGTAEGGGSRTVCEVATCETNCFNTCYDGCTYADTGCRQEEHKIFEGREEAL
jgi:hypothetical protein